MNHELLVDREARKEAGEIIGIFTPVMVARHEGKEIHLFFTGGKHASENLERFVVMVVSKFRMRFFFVSRLRKLAGSEGLCFDGCGSGKLLSGLLNRF